MNAIAVTELMPVILQKLQGHQLKREGTNRWRANWPKGDHDSRSLIIYETPGTATGGWFEYIAGGLRGNLVKLAGHLDIDVAPMTEHPDAPPPMSLAEYAQQHHVPAEVFYRAGWQDATYRGGMKAIKFSTANGDRYRMLEGDAKYIQVAGYKPCLYGLTRARRMAEVQTERQRPLVVCGSEASVVVAQHYGVPAFCQNMGEGKAWEPANLARLQQVLWPEQEILAVPDHDQAGRDWGKRTKESLERAGFRVRVLDTSSVASGKKGFDLADFCGTFQEQAEQRLSELPEIVYAPDCPTCVEKDAVIETQRTRIQELERQVAQLQQVQQHNRLQAQVMCRKELPQAARQVYLGVRNEMKCAPKNADTEDDTADWQDKTFHVRPWKIAEERGISPSTVSRELREWHEQGIVVKETRKVYDPDTQQTRPEVSIKWLVDPNNLDAIKREHKHGGHHPVECPDCGSHDIVEKRQRVCRGCGGILSEATYHEVNRACVQDAITPDISEVEEASLQDAITPVPDEACVQDAITPQVDSTTLKDAPFFVAERDCKLPVLSNGGESPSVPPDLRLTTHQQDAITVPKDGIPGLVARLRKRRQDRPAQGGTT